MGWTKFRCRTRIRTMRDQTGECWRPLEHALIGGVQPIWLVGPRRPRYIEWERGRGMEHEVHRSHSPLPHPYWSRVCMRPMGISASVLSTPPRRPDPPQCQWRARGFPLPTSTTVAVGPVPQRPELLCAISAMASASSTPPAADGLCLLTPLSLSCR